MEPKIIFEDSDILVLEKQAGMIVNRSDTTAGEETVQDWIASKFSIFNFQFSIERESSDFYNRAGIAHRLDKETSGILLVAKNVESFQNLQKQFKDRIVKKTYIALVHGKVEPQMGEINVPVGRLPWNRKRFGVVVGGREAVTRYKVLSIINVILVSPSADGRIQNLSRQVAAARDSGVADTPQNDVVWQARMTGEKEPLTLLELCPKTGRTHQIRVHLQYIHHPIFADPLYAGRKTSRNDRKILPRIFLHASKISFSHPKSGESISFESQLPKELQDFISNLE